MKNYRLLFLKNLSIPVRLRCVLVLVCAFILVRVQAQSSFLDSLPASLTSYNEKVVQEKVFLHTDKTFYLTGETLWFKAYVVRADTHRQMDLSKVLYVELFDDKSKPALQAMIDLKNGLGDGSFVLPPSLNSGMYLLRAYTAWMRNFDPAFFFQTPLQVVNTSRKPDWTSFEKKKTHTIQFFPEGGNLVEGISTKLGFQIVDQYGKGVDDEGYIIENAKDTVARFHPLTFGIGTLAFTPRKGAAYKAAIRLPDGEVVAGSLPPIEKQGYVLQVTETGKEQLKISAATNNAVDGQAIYLLAHTRGELKLASSKTVLNGKADWLIDKAVLGDGITSFTLFDAAQKPVCERLVFKRPERKLILDLKSDATIYGTRSRVNLSLALHNSQGQAVQGNFSLSVFLLDSLQPMDQTSIEEYLWLSSDLKGKIESPAYYFSHNDAEADAALDNLMLTHGWRRFRWEEIRTKQKPSFSFLPEYEGPILKGKVVSKASGDAVPNRLCFLSAPAEKFYAGNAVSNAKGELLFVTKNIYGPVELAVQADHSDSTVRIELSNSYAATQPSYSLPLFSLSEKWKEQLRNRHLAVQLANAFAPPVGQQFYLPPLSDTTVFYGQPDNRYLLDDYTRFPTMEEVMREVVAEVHLQKENDSFHYKVLNLPYKQHFDWDPLVLFDGVPVFNTNKIIAYDPLKVKKIEVMARRYYWGNITNNGIISYTTYDGNLGNFELDPGVVLMEYNGLQMKRDFYSPSYTTPEQMQNREPDKRNVLFWQPSVSVDSSEGCKLHFYTSDLPGRYAVHVQGIDAGGQCGSKWLLLDVK
jgi:hypothetical protein